MNNPCKGRKPCNDSFFYVCHISIKKRITPVRDEHGEQIMVKLLALIVTVIIVVIDINRM